MATVVVHQGVCLWRRHSRRTPNRCRIPAATTGSFSKCLRSARPINADRSSPSEPPAIAMTPCLHACRPSPALPPAGRVFGPAGSAWCAPIRNGPVASGDPSTWQTAATTAAGSAEAHRGATAWAARPRFTEPGSASRTVQPVGPIQRRRRTTSGARLEVGAGGVPAVFRVGLRE